MSTLREPESGQPRTQFRAIQQIVDHAVSPRRFLVLLVSSFAGFGLVLASLGIYGVISYSVSRQSQEIGIRMALGATAGQVQFGVVGADPAAGADRHRHRQRRVVRRSQAIASLLFGTEPTDPADLHRDDRRFSAPWLCSPDTSRPAEPPASTRWTSCEAHDVPVGRASACHPSEARTFSSHRPARRMTYRWGGLQPAIRAKLGRLPVTAPYSSRSTTIGSIRTARRAGIQPAAAAIAHSSSATIPYVPGSVAATP